MKKIVRGFALLVTILLLQLTILPSNVALSENDEMVLSELNIKVMPEFTNPENWDNNIPSLLVGYHGKFVNNSDSPYSGEIKINVPTHLPNFTPAFVAQFNEEEDTEPIAEEYTINTEEGYISWVPKNEIGPNGTYYFVLEYFSAPIEGVADKSFTYEFTPSENIDNVNIEVYAPYNSENFKIDKEANLNSVTFGLEFHLYEYSDVKEGEVYDLAISYTKDSIVTTMEALNEMTPPNDDAHAGFNQEAPQSQTSSTTENIILISITVLIIGAFIFIILRNKKSSSKVTKEVKNTPKKIVNKEEEVKKLRKMLADGQIDEKTYKEKRAKLG